MNLGEAWRQVLQDAISKPMKLITFQVWFRVFVTGNVSSEIPCLGKRI